MVSVRQVTQRNAGRKTAGIDGEVALTPEARAQVAVRVHQSASSWTPVAVKRVYIPKASSPAKLRPLGIPVLMDRCHQARVRNALEPEWEARFEPRSYGFRPGRGCHDAIEAIYSACKGPGSKRVWILDADLAAAFDKIDHSRLLQALGSFPARDLIEGWLKAGVFEAGKGFAPTGEGTPQGGLCSAEHKPPYEQCRVMRSAVLPGLVEAGSASRRCAYSRCRTPRLGRPPRHHAQRKPLQAGASSPGTRPSPSPYIPDAATPRPSPTPAQAKSPLQPTSDHADPAPGRTA
jgi:RNA-directed DNA polymerase